MYEATDGFAANIISGIRGAVPRPIVVSNKGLGRLEEMSGWQDWLTKIGTGVGAGLTAFTGGTAPAGGGTTVVNADSGGSGMMEKILPIALIGGVALGIGYFITRRK